MEDKVRLQEVHSIMASLYIEYLWRALEAAENMATDISCFCIEIIDKKCSNVVMGLQSVRGIA